MSTIMARSPLESSSSRRNFQWISRGSVKESEKKYGEEEFTFFTDEEAPTATAMASPAATKKKTLSSASVAVMRLRSVIAAVIAGRDRLAGLGPRVTGTIFGRRRGHVKLAFQADQRSSPAILVELAKPTSALVREMASGMVRIALEAEKAVASTGRLLDQPLWQAYCNGRKCGYAVRRECGASDWKVLKAIEPVTMGAGVLPAEGDEPEGEMMFMRARFERVVGSRDSEAFYMMNPDGNSGAELSVYLLRV
ncbi:protein MIZU-KUSSEI 1-like [Dioscorea cayenensis subsp. rotundata]|uniref:Protein MIZU-KUSSEI 1-like n=1 Tax=Dioscorea cayennensis subsp. rotundata TaxID=55577 RepID=A0AB40CUM5_DIOCR|nr:protein MIZU-KUSSEI 1-like [Dioscorea cayenensis subsp. rotundata]